MKIATFFLLSFILLGCKQQTKNSNEINKTNSTDSLMLIDNDSVNELDKEQTYQSYDLRKIDSTIYFTLKRNAVIHETKFEKIINLALVKEILKKRVLWGKYDEESGKIIEDEQGDDIYKIICRNGETLTLDDEDLYFVAYYPEEEILFFEGGHTSDVSYSLITGEGTDEVGNPDYIDYSTTKKYRLNGSFGGQECSDYFIQEKIGNQYKKIIELNSEFEDKTGIMLCNIRESYWQSDTILNIATDTPDDEGTHEIKLYYQIIIK